MGGSSVIGSRVLASAFSILLVALTVGLAAPSFAVTGSSAVDRFGGCLAAQRSGDILLMIDESGSLQQSDPDANRVTAAKYLAQRLADFSADADVSIDVAVAGFSDDYRPYLDWTRIDASNLPAVESAIDAFRDRNNGQDTDYWLALNGARTTLAGAPRRAEGRPCQALAWFTDGKLDFEQRDVEKPYAPGQNLDSAEGVAGTIAAAQESICRDRGLADQLRSSDIVTFGIGLAPTPEQSGDFDLMKAIVTGEPAGSVTSCGAVTKPVPGAFYLAQNINDLLFAFDAFSSPGQAPIETSTGACANVICEEAKHRFVLDRSVRSVSVLAAADRPGLVPYLIAPDGASLPLDGPAAVGDLAGVAVDHRPQGDKSVSFKLFGSQAPQWQGVWALVFVDPSGDATARTRSSIHIAGDLYPAWPDSADTTLHSGDGDVVLNLAMVDGRGQPVDPATLLGQATLSAVLVDVAGGEHPVVSGLPKDQIATPQRLDLIGVPPGAATLHLSLDVTTAEARDASGAAVPGTKLAPQSVDLPATIDPPVGYPKVAESIDFGDIEGAGTVAAELQITGPGCAWLPKDAGTTIEGAPDGVGDVTLSSTANSTDSCVKPVDGQQQSLPVALNVPEAGNGAVTGTIKVMAGPSDGTAEPIAVEVPFTASLTKPLDPWDFWWALAAGLILGPGIPLLLFYGSKWWVSRIPARGLKVQEIPVRVTADAVYRDNGPLVVRRGELVDLVPGLDQPVRKLEVGNITLKTRIGLSPLGGGFVVASKPGYAGSTGPDGTTHGKTPDAKLPLAVHNHWFVLIDPSVQSEDATLVLMVAGGAEESVVNGMLAEVSSNLPRVVTDLRAKAKSRGEGDAEPQHAHSAPGGGGFDAPAGSPFGGTPLPNGPFGGTPSAPPSGPYGGASPPPPSPPPGGPFGGQSNDPQSPFR